MARSAESSGTIPPSGIPVHGIRPRAPVSPGTAFAGGAIRADERLCVRSATPAGHHRSLSVATASQMLSDRNKSCPTATSGPGSGIKRAADFSAPHQ
jgi:hypothetical protein